MKNPTLLLPGFHFQTLRRKPRTERQKLAEEMERISNHSLSKLSEVFSNFIRLPNASDTSNRTFTRRRLFSRENIFWAFFSQILNADNGCREITRKIQAQMAAKGLAIPSSSTSAYCQARAKLEERVLSDVLQTTGEQLQAQAGDLRWKQRRVIVVDGTGVSMPDTSANQGVWPQPNSQKTGCGFPQARICACFCLATGALLSYRLGNKKSHELPLLQDQWSVFEDKDIMLADKGFCSYFDISNLKDRGVDSVHTLARRKPVNAQDALAVLGEDDLLVRWTKPVRSTFSRYSQEDSEALPDELVLRQIKVTVGTPGFRSSHFYLMTTLLDAEKYTAADLADLYFQRWDVELFFRDIKTTMDMDVLKCRSPKMVKKEILMHFIVYNAMRFLMLESAKQKNISPRKISFKASLQALRQWEPEYSRPSIDAKEIRRLIVQMYNAIVDTILPERPHRSEPRCVKRRPKTFQLMTKPRHEMKETFHRGRNTAKRA